MAEILNCRGLNTYQSENIRKDILSLKKAVFIDRDGTINHERNYLSKISDLRLLPYVSKGIARLNSAGLFTIVISNQSGIGRGYHTKEDFDRVNNEIQKRLKRFNAHIDTFYFCPHHPTDAKAEYKIKCSCRKPETGLLEQAAREHNIDLEKSFFIGDALTDIKAGNRMRCKTILVMTGYGRKVIPFIDNDIEAKPDFVAENFLEAVNFILM